MGRVFYITRTYLPGQNGPVLMRLGTVQGLEKNGFSVHVITPNYTDNQLRVEGNISYIPFGFSAFLGLTLEKIGIFEDYMDVWVKTSLEYLRSIVEKDDIVLATSGGELGCIKLAILLKKFVGCKVIINFHDPIAHIKIEGKAQSKVPRVSREPVEKKYLFQADLIITSSKYYKKVLEAKYPILTDKIHTVYFGYFEYTPVEKKDNTTVLNIAYAGAMQKLQSPEILSKAAFGLGNVNIYYIGNHKNYHGLDKYRKSNVLIDQLPYNEYLSFMTKNIDIGFVSLASDFFKVCVPSKIFDYINLGLPMLGALPKGDAMDIINKNEYGIACHYDDFNGIAKAIEILKNAETRAYFRDNILRDRETWSMESKITEMSQIIKGIK